jgi:hypothetical protein
VIVWESRKLITMRECIDTKIMYVMIKLGLDYFNHLNQMITLYVITLSGFHCIINKAFN